MCDVHSRSPSDAPRRAFLARAGAGALLLTPLAVVLTGCNKGDWPEGMAAIAWDRDTCARCNMVISDRRFAAEMRGGAADTVFKFDDLGCLLFWMEEKAAEHAWMGEAKTRLWVAGVDSRSRDEMIWLDPRHALYVTRTSPMGYNFGAVAAAAAGAVDFNEIRRHTLARGR